MNDDFDALISRARDGGLTVLLRPDGGHGYLDDFVAETGLTHPDELVDFYAHYEAMQLGTSEFVWSKLLLRRYREAQARHPWLDNRCVPILGDGFGGNYYVVCKTEAIKGPAPAEAGTVVYNPGGAAGVLEPVAPGFMAFLALLVERMLHEARLS